MELEHNVTDIPDNADSARSKIASEIETANSFLDTDSEKEVVLADVDVATDADSTAADPSDAASPVSTCLPDAATLVNPLEIDTKSTRIDIPDNDGTVELSNTDTNIATVAHADYTAADPGIVEINDDKEVSEFLRHWTRKFL